MSRNNGAEGATGARLPAELSPTCDHGPQTAAAMAKKISMNTTTTEFVKRSRNVLTGVNLLLVLAVYRQLHSVLLHQTGHTALVYSLPSALLALLAALGLAFVIGLRWLRPPGLACAVQLALLATGCLLLMMSWVASN